MKLKALHKNDSKSFVKKKHKGKGDIEFAPVYVNCTNETVINSKYMFDKSFQKILCGIDK